MKKKLSVLVAAVLALSLCLTACAPKLDGTETIAVMDETNIPLAEVNLMLRYQQAQQDSEYSEMLGISVYDADLDNDDIDDGVAARDSLLDLFGEMYVMEAEAVNYGVALTEEENAAIAAAAKAFMEANADEKVQAALAATEADMVHLLELITINQRMYEAIGSEVNTDIPDEEVAQAKTTYMFFNATTTDDAGNMLLLEGDELKAVEEQANAVLADIEGGMTMEESCEARDLTWYNYTYGDTTNQFDPAVKEALAEMKEGETSGVIPVEGGFYIVRLDTLMDPEATEAMRQLVITNQKDQLFSQRVAELMDVHTYEVNQEVVEKLTFAQIITFKEAE